MPNRPATPHPTVPRVDAHQHFWDPGRFDYPWMSPPELAPLRRPFLPADLKPHLDRAGVDASIFVQARHDTAETDWALELADDNPWIAGVVGWLDLTAPPEELERQVDYYRGFPKFVGVRHNVHDEPDDRWLLRDDVLRGLGMLAKFGVPFDLLIRPRHLPHATHAARRLPELRLVVDHLAKPPIAAGTLEPWRSDLATLAAEVNVVCKVSGLVTEANQRTWTAADLRPYVESVLELFGPSSVMFGSDWPVCTLASDYAEVALVVERLTESLSPSERAALFGGTAIDIYQLDLPDEP